MRKVVQMVSSIILIALSVAACKVKKHQNDLAASQKTETTFSISQPQQELEVLLVNTWTVNLVNYQADARKEVVYQKGDISNLHDYSKETIKLKKDGTVVYIDEGGEKHEGEWELEDNGTKLSMSFKDGQELNWDIIKKDSHHLDLHLSINAQKVNWDIQNLEDIDLSTAAVFAGFYAGIVDEHTQTVNITYRMTPRG
jgi:Tfp pilus assembly major pilin PilA